MVLVSTHPPRIYRFTEVHDGTLLSLPVVSPRGDRYSAAVTSVDMEMWLGEQKRKRRAQERTKLRQQLQEDMRGRLCVTLLYPPGRPALSLHEFDTMLSLHFGGYTEPRQVELKDGSGRKIEGTGNLTWGAYVAPMREWPVRLPHPTLGDKYYYLFLLQSDYCQQYQVCKYCHQTSCKAKHRMACLEYRRSQRRPEDKINRAARGYTTLEQATENDPMAYHYSTTSHFSYY